MVGFADAAHDSDDEMDEDEDEGGVEEKTSPALQVHVAWNCEQECDGAQLCGDDDRRTDCGEGGPCAPEIRFCAARAHLGEKPGDCEGKPPDGRVGAPEAFER